MDARLTGELEEEENSPQQSPGEPPGGGGAEEPTPRRARPVRDEVWAVITGPEHRAKPSG